jgi:hypothetical protein
MVSHQPHASAALPPRKETSVPIAEEAVWAPEPGSASRDNFGFGVFYFRGAATQRGLWPPHS